MKPSLTEHKLIEAALKATETQLAEVQQLARLGSWLDVLGRKIREVLDGTRGPK